jgi:hypothetical protein
MPLEEEGEVSSSDTENEVGTAVTVQAPPASVGDPLQRMQIEIDNQNAEQQFAQLVQRVPTKEATPTQVEYQKTPEELESERSDAAMQFQEKIKATFPTEAKTFNTGNESFTLLKSPMKIEHANLGPMYGNLDKTVLKHLLAGPNGPRILEFIEYPNGEMNNYENSEEALQERLFSKGVSFREPGQPITIISGSIVQSEAPYYQSNGSREVISLGSQDPGHAVQAELGKEDNSFVKFRKPNPGEVQELLDYAKAKEQQIVYVEKAKDIAEDLSFMAGLDFGPTKINN